MVLLNRVMKMGILLDWLQSYKEKLLGVLKFYPWEKVYLLQRDKVNSSQQGVAPFVLFCFCFFFRLDF